MARYPLILLSSLLGIKMEVKAIQTEMEHQLALQIASKFFDNPPNNGTDDADYFEKLLVQIEIYEKDRYPISNADMKSKN